MPKARGLRRQQARIDPVPVEQWSKDFLDKVKNRFDEFLDDLDPPPHSAVAEHVKQYKQLCSRLGVPRKPAAAPLAQFVLGLAAHGYPLSTIECSVAAVCGMDDKGTAKELVFDEVVQRALKAAGKMAASSAGQQQPPLDKEDLLKVVRALGSTDEFVSCRDIALFLLAWAGMFSSSELITLTWEDYYVDPGLHCAVVHVPLNLAEGEGRWVAVAHITPDPELCPVCALDKLSNMCSKSGAMFTASAGGSALSKATLERRLKRALQTAGVPQANSYSVSSLRRGGAMCASQSRVLGRRIFVQGIWQEDVVRKSLYAAPDGGGGVLDVLERLDGAAV